MTTLSVLGDAMARPLVEDLARSPGRYDISSLVAVNSSAAVLSPAVRGQILSALPGVERMETAPVIRTVKQASPIAVSVI